VLVELGLLQQRHKAVLEVLNAATVTDVARRYGVVRQGLHDWLRRYVRNGMAALSDRSSKPLGRDPVAIRLSPFLRTHCRFCCAAQQPFCGSDRRQQAAALVVVMADQPPMNVTCFA